MPNGSVGGSIAQGLQAGFGMGRQLEADRVQAEQRAFENTRQTAQDQRAQKAAELAETHNALAASRERLGMLASQNAGLLQQYGAAEKIPPDLLQAHTGELETAQKTHTALLDKLAPQVADWRQQAENNASRMKAGELDPRTMATADLVHTITGSTGQPIENYLPSPDGKPALVKQMANDFRVGVEGQNEGLVLKAVNGLFSRELKAGVGQPSPHGGTILGKQIIKILPAPTDPNNPEDPNAGKVTPVIRVFVREGGENAGVGEQRRMASNEEQRYGAPPGATGHYDAPITKNRSSDPNDPVMHISMDEAMNRIGQMESLASAFEDPALLARAKQGIVEAGDAPNKFLQAFYAVGGKTPTKIESYENVPIGKQGTVRITKNAQGVETKREMLGAPDGAPSKPEKVGGLGQRFHDIEASDLTDEDKAKAKRVAALGVKGAGLSSEVKATISHAVKGLTAEQNAALFGPDGAVTTRRLDPGKINSKTASIFADAELSNPGTDFAKMSGDIALGRNATFRQKAMVAEALPEIMTNMVEAGKKVGFSDVKSIGKMQAWVKGETNDPDLTSYMSQRNDALMTIAGVMRGVGMTDMAHKAETEVAAPTMSPKALDAWFDGQMKALSPRLKLNREITGARGNTPVFSGKKNTPAAVKDNKPAVSADDDALINKYLKK